MDWLKRNWDYGFALLAVVSIVLAVTLTLQGIPAYDPRTYDQQVDALIAGLPEASKQETGIVPGIITVPHISKGGEDHQSAIRIFNWYDHDITCRAVWVVPRADAVRKGYNTPPEGAEAWVTFEEHILVPARQSVDLDVTLAIPKDAKIYPWYAFWFWFTGYKYEFRVGIYEEGQGSVEAGAACRWLVSVR